MLAQQHGSRWIDLPRLKGKGYVTELHCISLLEQDDSIRVKSLIIDGGSVLAL